MRNAIKLRGCAKGLAGNGPPKTKDCNVEKRVVAEKEGAQKDGHVPGLR